MNRTVRDAPAAFAKLLLWGLPLLAAAALLVDRWLPSPVSPEGAEFQHMLGGLGMGCATTLEQGPRTFDFRLGTDVPQDRGPIIAGGWFSTAETMSLLPVGSACRAEPLPSNGGVNSRPRPAVGAYWVPGVEQREPPAELTFQWSASSQCSGGLRIAPTPATRRLAGGPCNLALK